MAMSALRSKLSGCVRRGALSARPMLALMKTSRSPMASGPRSASPMRSAARDASASSSSSSRRMVNSSPPRRATVSPARTHDFRRSATSTSKASPAWWPRLSLITLKLSRSRNSTATRCFRRSACATARWSRSRKRVRLGNPVSESWSAWCSSAASACLRRLMSVLMPMTALGLPLASSLSAQRLATTTGVPSRRVCSSSPSQRPLRTSSALISARGIGNRVCKTACGVLPSTSAFCQPYSSSAPRFQNRIAPDFNSQTRMASCARSSSSAWPASLAACRSA